MSKIVIKRCVLETNIRKCIRINYLHFLIFLNKCEKLKGVILELILSIKVHITICPRMLNF